MPFTTSFTRSLKVVSFAKNFFFMLCGEFRMYFLKLLIGCLMDMLFIEIICGICGNKMNMGVRNRVAFNDHTYFCTSKLGFKNLCHIAYTVHQLVKAYLIHIEEILNFLP